MKSKAISCISVLCAVVLVLAGCASAPTTATPTTAPTSNGYVFVYKTVEVTMNQEATSFLSAAGDPRHYFEAVSCAFEGLDKIYTFGSFELDTYPDGKKDRVSSILLLDDNIATVEGVRIGSMEKAVTDAYGTGYTTVNGERVYTKGKSELHFIVESGTVTSIEYVAITN